MKKIILAAASLMICVFPFASAFADNSVKQFECSGQNLDKTPFELAPNTGVMPVAIVAGNTVSVEYTETNGQDTLAVIIKGDTESRTISGSALGDVYYVDGAFWVLCRPAQQ